MQPRLLPSAAVARPAPPAPLRPPPPCPTPCDAGSSPTPPARQQPPALPRRRLPCAGAAHPVLALLRRRRTPCIRPAPCARLLPASSPAPAPVLAAASADVHGFFPLYVEELPASLPPAQKDAVALPEELDDLLLNFWDATSEQQQKRQPTKIRCSAEDIPLTFQSIYLSITRLQVHNKVRKLYQRIRP
ncbi:hypothetical protein E2562_034492 [Oryza meyeriana var. granulata]|uniref:Uncharacterized protein n=1 Tax=Oryza meyeriana var. granulata TaxID=110450 RepID=A0A6G1CUV9_9ORYZ|nr:hypothetical protein E2562_034492 [Oryza meyeriana var. granulata]KAF0904415.1 hypothetical protein E2562_034492 [Oryza meyeriana var. granulata]